MGNSKKTLISLAFILGILLVVPHSQNLVPAVRSGAPPNSPYTGSGGSLDVFEFARNESNVFTDGINTTSFQYDASWFPSDYRGYQLVTSVTNLVRTEDPILNGDFDKYDEAFNIDGSQLDVEVQNWTLTQNDGKSGDDNKRIIASIYNNTGGNPGDCMDIELRYGKTDLTEANATLESEFSYVSALSPTNLTFSFDIKFSSDITQENWLFVIVSLEYQAEVIASWQQTTDSYHPTSWDHHAITTSPINGTVTLRLTVMKQGGNKRAPVNGHIYFDNFRYTIETPSKPSEVALTLNSEVVTDAGDQTGLATIYADPTNRHEAPLSNCWTTTQNYQFDSSYNISFHYSYAMYVKHLQSTQATASFSAPVDENPTWEVNYSIPMDQPPAGHVGYSYGLYLKPLWSFTEVKNETGHTLSTYSYNASSQFFKLDNGVASPGQIYSIYASSLNYVLQVYLQKSATGLGDWENLSNGDYYVANDWLRVKATLRPIGPSGNSANVSIFYPNQTLWQSETSVTFHDDNNTLTSSAWQIPNIEEADAGSDWVATLAYNNETQCGLKQQSFTVVIPTQGNEISPADQNRVILGETVLVNVTWANDVTSQFIVDASAQIRYIDRNLQVQYEPMTPNGLGAYSANFDTGSMSPDQNAEFYVELFRYGYVNATYADGTYLTFTINLVNNLEYSMIKPTQETGPNEYTAQTTRDAGYTSQVRFYDSYLDAYVRNDSGIWMNNVRVNFTYYVDPTGLPGWTPISTGSFVPDSFDATIFLRYDASYGDFEAVKYEVSMWVDGSFGWEYEQQNFTIIIEIVSFATNLDAIRTHITNPPAGSGDGWTQYENDTDVYTANLYWNELFNITVFYENETTSTGIPGATVQLLIGMSLYPLTDNTGGYYYYILNTTTLGLGQTDLYVNASLAAHAEQTIRIRVIVESRATQLTKDYPRSSVEIPYNDDFMVVFNFTDIVPSSPIYITSATVLVEGYESGKYTISNHLNGSYSILFWGNISETIYDVTVYFSLANYTTQHQYLEITIRYIETYASGSALSGSVPWGDNVTITLSFNDTDHGYIGIDGASLTFTWFDNIENVDFWIILLGDGTYSIILNTTKVSLGTQGFTLTFVLNRTHYESAQVAVSFQVRDILTALYIVSISPGSSVPWGDTLTLTLTFNDTDHDHIPIPYATITCDWDEFYWSFAYTPATGAYTLTIRTESRLEGSYTIHIYAGKSHYQTFMALQNFMTRNIQTNYQADPLYIPSQPWGDNVTIRLYYLDLDHGGYIPFAEIDTDWNDTFYTIYLFGNGTYIIEFNTTCREVGSYTILITLSRTHYITQNVEIDLTLRNIQTDVTADPSYIWSHPWGDNTTITINYLDQDHTAYVLSAIISLDWNASYYTIYDLGNGTYLIELNTTCRNIGSHNIEITLSRLHYVTQIIEIDLTIREIQTGYSVDPAYIPSNPWGDNITIQIDYIDLDHGGYIHGALIGVDWNTSYFTIYDLGNGTYLIELNTSCREVGSHSITIDVTLFHYGSQIIQVDLTLRDIQTDFEVDASVFPSHPWGDNVTVRINFLDVDHSDYVTSALVTTDWNASFYKIYSLGNGTYVIEFNTTCRANGLHISLVSLSRIHYAGQIFQVRITLRDIQTDTDADPLYITSHPWGVNLTIQVDYIDLEHSGFVLGASVGTDWDLGYYTIYDLFNGTYLIELNTTSRDVGSFAVQITLNQLHYESQIVNVQFTLHGRNTQVSYSSPEPVPFTEDLTFTIFYNDSATTDPIHNVTGNVYITVGCSSHPTLTLNYTILMLNNGYDGYFVTIRTHNFLEVNVWYSFVVNITWPNITPYYQNQSLPVSGYVRSIHTSMELSFDSIVFWGDLLYLNATYHDIDHDVVLSNGTVTLWLSWPSWSLVQIYPDGTYLIQIDSSAEDIGLANFTIRFSKPFYETSEQQVQFTVNPLPLYVEVLSTSPWVAEYQTLVNISVRVTDEYGRLMNDTMTTYYWAGLSPVNMTFVGNGIYNIIFFANQTVGTYLVTIEASNLPNYQTSIGIVMLNIIPIDSVLAVSGPASPVIAGDTFQINANFSTIYGSALPNATVYFNWAGGNGTLSYISGWTFESILNSSGLDAGQYTIYITASHQNVIEQLRTVSISLIVMPAYLECDTPVINVDWGHNFTVRAHFYDNNLLNITGANIQYIWGTLNGTLQPTGTPGWYNISLPSDIFAVGVYELTLTCDHEGYQYVMITIGLNIQPRQTNLDIIEIQAELDEQSILIPLNGTSWEVPRGDILWIYLNFTDGDGITVTSATGVYTWEFGSGVLQFSNGLYFASINLTDVTPGIYGVSITLTRHNFETANAPLFQLTVIPVPTEIIGLDDTLSITTGESFSLQVTFYDTYHDIVITDATLFVSLPAIGIHQRPMFNNGDGTYTLPGLSVLTEGTYSVTIESVAAPKYAQAQDSMTLVVSLSPLFRAAIQAGAALGVILIIVLLAWLAYARIYSIPWIVRRMRKMTKAIDRGKVPSLSKSDITRISDRDNQIVSMITPSYSTLDVPIQPVVIPTTTIPAERRSEDEDVLVELEQLEGLGAKEKEELFKQMKKIPAKDRVWFMEDMKRQMAEGRFDYLRTGDAEVEGEAEEVEAPATPGLSPSEQATLVAVLREGLDQFTMISDDDKEALVQQLIIMTPEERESTIKKLMARMKGLQLEEPDPAPKMKKRKKKADS